MTGQVIRGARAAQAEAAHLARGLGGGGVRRPRRPRHPARRGRTRSRGRLWLSLFDISPHRALARSRFVGLQQLHRPSSPVRDFWAAVWPVALVHGLLDRPGAPPRGGARPPHGPAAPAPLAAPLAGHPAVGPAHDRQRAHVALDRQRRVRRPQRAPATQSGLLDDYQAWLSESATSAMWMVILADVWKMTPLVAILAPGRPPGGSPASRSRSAQVDGAEHLPRRSATSSCRCSRR